MTESYECAACGQTHADLPLSFAADSPDMYANMDRDERDARCVRGSDQYIIDQKWSSEDASKSRLLAQTTFSYGDFGPQFGRKSSTKYRIAGNLKVERTVGDPLNADLPILSLSIRRP